MWKYLALTFGGFGRTSATVRAATIIFSVEFKEETKITVEDIENFKKVRLFTGLSKF